MTRRDPNTTPPRETTGNASGNVLAGGTGTDRSRSKGRPVAPAHFPGPQGREPELPARDVAFLYDIPVQVTVRLGGARLLLRDLLELGPGSVVELDRMAGEPLEVLVNGRLLARGEAVVVNGKFGVRLTELVGTVEEGGTGVASSDAAPPDKV